MAISEAYQNSASISTIEYSLPNNSTTLTPITVDGVYQVFIDFNAMLAGDEYQIRIYEKISSGDVQRIVMQANLVGPQSPPIWISPSLILLHGWDVTVDKIAGSNRTIAWSIRKVA